MRKIAVSDIHGCALTFDALLDKIALSTTDELYLLGDYVDRGPDSKGVIDIILELRSRGQKVICLKGNHEDMMLKAINDNESYHEWRKSWGGKETLASFGAFSITELPPPYFEFLNQLLYYIEVDEFILVHAGLNFQTTNPLIPNESMLYSRYWYNKMDYDWLNDRVVVHGHTPVAKSEIEDMLEHLTFRMVINIDCGCFANHLPGKGYLCAFDITNRELIFQPSIDDTSSFWKNRA